MKLISVQSRGNRIVIINDYETFQWRRQVRRVVVKRKEMLGKNRWRFTCRGYKTQESALKAAAEWLEGANE